jgi:putative transposase
MWRWQSLDSSTVKSPLGGGEDWSQSYRQGQARDEEEAHPHRQERGPLSAVITSANTDMKAAFETLDSIVVKRPHRRRYHRQHLCLDKGYDHPEIERGVIARDYIPHMRHRGDLEDPMKRYKPKRWVVERSASWLNRFRKLLIRWEKKTENYLGLVQLACSITVYRRTILG